jgi:hypothetical protein
MRAGEASAVHGLRAAVMGDGRSWGAAAPGFRIRACLPVLCALFLLLALVSSASAGTLPRFAGTVRLSNERTFTRWAHPLNEAPIRTLPKVSSHQITRSRFFTEDGFPNVYLFLRSWTDPHGRTWVHVRIPMRPNGKTGWIREDSFGPMQLVRTRLVVDRRRLRATLYRRGRRIWRASIGVGKPGTPTPPGHFWIRELFQVTPPGGLYGPWAFGTSDYSTLSDWPKGGVIGIHGTNEPRLIPGRPSHGCIRMRNAAITRLAHRMPIGTPVLIR